MPWARPSGRVTISSPVVALRVNSSDGRATLVTRSTKKAAVVDSTSGMPVASECSESGGISSSFSPGRSSHQRPDQSNCMNSSSDDSTTIFGRRARRAQYEAGSTTSMILAKVGVSMSGRIPASM